MKTLPFVFKSHTPVSTFFPNFVITEPLLDLTCLQVSCQLMGKSAEEIRNILNIPQMTEAEEKEARREHRWIFDD